MTRPPSSADPGLAASFPRLAAYLDGLPDGLASYPSCQARTSVARALLESADLAPAATVPPLVAQLLDPPSHGWIPEARLQATVLAIADLRGVADEAHLAWMHTVNLEIYRSPIYRALMAFLAPRTLLERGASRWEAFHRGTTLVTTPSTAARSAEAVLTFPPRLFNHLLLRGYAETFHAALVHSRAQEVTVEVAGWDETSAHFLARWR